MQQIIKNQFPKWCEDTKTKFELLMSDDIDSLMCFQIENFLGRDCEYFIDMNSNKIGLNKTGTQYLYCTDNATKSFNNIMALDFSINR